MKRFAISTSMLALLGVAGNAVAHDAWVEPGEGPDYKILYGHKVPEAYPMGKVKTVQVLDAQRAALPHEVVKSGAGALLKVKGRPAMFTLFFDNGYWTKIGDESKNVGKTREPWGTGSSHPLKYGKTITQWTPWSFQPQGQRIEIVPLKFNGQPKANSEMTVQVLLDGKPLPGMMIENNSDEKGPITDADGKATVTLTSGVQRLATDYDVEISDDPNADKLTLTAALVFVAQ